MIKIIDDGDGTKSQVCFGFQKGLGACTKGSTCRFQHTDEEPKAKRVTFSNPKGKGKGKPQAKTVDDVKFNVKGLRGGKGGKGKGKGKAGTSGKGGTI